MGIGKTGFGSATIRRYFGKRSSKHSKNSPSLGRKRTGSAQGPLVAGTSVETLSQGGIPASILALGVDLPRTALFTGTPTKKKSVTPTERGPGTGDGGGTVRKTKTALEVAAEMAATDDTVRLAIECHEKGQLEKSLEYLRIAAERGAPSALFLLGMALRHGWGCEVNPQQAFQYLQKAADTAATELNQQLAQTSAKNNGNQETNFSETRAAKAELVLSVYELGISFMKGWGVQKDKVTAAYYFEIAANLGDPDAQNDIAACYYNGQGVKKDVFKAAKYFRLAAAQGHGIVGNCWIYKDKYGGLMPGLS